jgi:signal peptidase I
MIHTLRPNDGDAGFSLLEAGLAGDLPVVSHLSTLTITSWSMFPTIHKGDAIEVGPADPITAGDIVVFHHAGILVCHRVVGTDAGGDIRTQGDQATGQDPPVPRQDILGKVTAVIRRGRRFPPTVAPEASATDVFSMRMDLFLGTLRARLHDAAWAGAAFLKRRAWVRQLAMLVLNKYVRFDIGIRAPIRLVQAYRFLPFQEIPHGSCFSDDLIVLAHLGGHPLATFDPASGKVRIRRIAAGLGLEESLHNLNHRLQSARASTPS